MDKFIKPINAAGYKVSLQSFIKQTNSDDLKPLTVGKKYKPSDVLQCNWSFDLCEYTYFTAFFLRNKTLAFKLDVIDRSNSIEEKTVRFLPNTLQVTLANWRALVSINVEILQ